MMQFDVVVVIVTYNSSHVVEALLDSLPKAADGVPLHVAVVDNGSTDGTPDLLEQRQDCHVIRAANDGYAAGINRGIRDSARAPAVLVLNPDVVLHPGAIRTLVEALAADDRGVVVPRVLDSAGKLAWSLRREPTLLRAMGLSRLRRPMLSEYCNDPRDYEAGHFVDWALGAVLVFTRECYDAVGGWDESFFLYSEETDFLLRARDLGFRTWYEPAATATHIGKQSGYNSVTHTMLAVNRVRLYRRRHGIVASWLYFATSLLIELVWLIRGQRECRAAIIGLLNPKRRPAQLGCSDRLMPT